MTTALYRYKTFSRRQASSTTAIRVSAAKHTSRWQELLSFFFVFIASLTLVPAAHADALRAFGLTTDGFLVRFTTAAPGNTKDVGFITGLQGDSYLIGIDFRVQDGFLYGVGNLGGLYTINTKTAQATLRDTLDIAPDGNTFGVDFNPAANALRIVSDTGQNLRHPFTDPVNPGPTVGDTALMYGPPVSLPATGISAAAYTNNDDPTATGPDAATTGTTLFDIDTATVPPATDPQDVVVIQSPANNGLVVATGSLRVDAGMEAGFDIFTRRRNGGAVANRGFASLFVDGGYHLFQINLLTGRALRIGAFGDPVVDITFPIKQ